MNSIQGCRCAVAVLVVAWATASFAQPAPMSPEYKNAQSLFQAQRFAEAAVAYEAVVKSDPADPRAHAGLAAALYSIGQFEKALPSAMEANRLLDDSKTQLQYPGLPRGAVMLRIARLHNRLGRLDQAFSWMQKAVALPLPNPQLLDTEPDMANLRADERWKKVAETLKATIDPCNSRPEFRQLDFWVGEWDVFGTGGQKVGTSKVERTLNNCVIFETYRAEPGSAASPQYVGQAFHFFDPNSSQWVQHYIDTVAGPFDWTGAFSDGAILYVREGPFGPANVMVKQRMSFKPIPGGKVRQLFEQSADGGKSWRAGFDGTYVKRGTTSSQADGQRK